MKELLKDRVFWLVFAMVAVISTLHYTTAVSMEYFHEFYKLLYYIPIIVAAFYFGVPGGLITSLAVSIVYLPHIMFQWTGKFPHNLDRFLEIVIYIAVSLITGWLAQNERRERQRYQKAAMELNESYAKLKRQSEELSEIEAQLRHSDRLSVLGELTANLAHEVRNPLGSIRGAVEILEDELPEEQRQGEFFQVLRNEVDRLDQVIEGYLDLARRGVETTSQLDLTEAVHSVLSALAYRARKQKIQFQTEFPSQPILLSANESQFRQVVLHLLLNAMAASPNGGTIHLKACLSAKEETSNHHDLIFSIEDQGEGMTPDVARKAMQPFFTTKREGTGLGLPISKRIIDQHGWKMRLESTPKRGTKVIIQIPKEDIVRGNEKKDQNSVDR